MVAVAPMAGPKAREGSAADLGAASSLSQGIQITLLKRSERSLMTGTRFSTR